jgi:hypothetical protein
VSTANALTADTVQFPGIKPLQSRADIFLYSTARPIIESSSNIRFGCFEYCYFRYSPRSGATTTVGTVFLIYPLLVRCDESLQEHLDKARLNTWENRWSEIYDYTPAQGRGPNFLLHPPDCRPAAKLKVLCLKLRTQSKSLTWMAWTAPGGGGGRPGGLLRGPGAGRGAQDRCGMRAAPMA